MSDSNRQKTSNYSTRGLNASVPEVRSHVYESHFTVTREDLPVSITLGHQAKWHITIRQAIGERYSQTAHFVLDKECWPDSYTFTGEDESFSRSKCFPVIRRPQESWFCPPAFGPETLVWLELNQEQKDKLFCILLTGVFIRNLVYYDTDSRGWKSRICRPTEDFPQIFRSLKFKRADDEKQTEHDVLQELTKGRTEEEMKGFLESPFHKFISENLEEVWTSALVAGMVNDEGWLAVYTLLNFIFQTLQGLDMRIPPIKIVNATSAAPKDCMSVASNSSTDTFSDHTPSVKRRKLDYQPKKQKDGKGDDNKSEKCESGATSVAHRQHVDLSVVTQDAVNGVAKFLIVIEIHSWDKTEDEMKQKLMQEMIFVLQRQNEVFGLLFLETRVDTYKARKDGSGVISFFNNTYSLLDIFCEYGTFRVSSFQRLILDILTCIVYGLKHIQA